jgi:hypothetical protein
MQQQQVMSSANRLSTGAQHTSRFKPPAGLGVIAGATHSRRSSEGNTSDSANEAEGTGAHAQRQSHRLHLNPGQISNRLQAPAVTHPAHKQNTLRGMDILDLYGLHIYATPRRNNSDEP